MAESPIRAHQEWLGLIQPVGLVVVPSALVDAGIVIEETERTRWQTYLALLSPPDDDGQRALPSFITFAEQVLGWDLSTVTGAQGGPALADTLTVALPELRARLEPTFAVPDPEGGDRWQLLVQVQPAGTDLDRAASNGGWTAPPHDQFERLLRDTGVPLGLLVTDAVLRIVYAPSGESSGYLSFPVTAMSTVSGRPMFLALVELLKGWRLSRACPTAGRLNTVLRESRKYQNTVSTKLAEQVLGSLYDLVRGMQAADEASGGNVVRETLSNASQEVYGGLLTTIMRLVFVLYAEERGMLPQDAAWIEHYGVGALYQQLVQDRAKYPDTMDQRFGAWARLLTLARILHDGAHHGSMRIPARAGELFDPDRYPFLEGRPYATRRVMGDRLTNVPRVSDGCVLRVLEQLLVLKGERLSYRALDVEQIGSVYEAMMGFEVRPALGASVAVVPKAKAKGSPSHPVVDLDALLKLRGDARAKWLKDECDCEVPPANAMLLKTATSVDGLLEALQKRVSNYTPVPTPLGGLTLQPTEERRRSGSHYTPRELTEPIVATTLRPIFEAMGAAPTPEQILALKLCDPAMGSGAFLVGACRFLGVKLVEAWQRQGSMPAIPPDEDPQLYAQRLVSQQCLYGVDRNPYAVQLAKLSLWLVTLAREHPFTFLDHALRHGDSLVGLTRRQIMTFSWAPDGGEEMQLWSPRIDEWMNESDAARDTLEGMASSDDTFEKQRLLTEADRVADGVRRIGDAVIAAYFGAEKDKQRKSLRLSYEDRVVRAIEDGEMGLLDELADELRAKHIVPFHWEVEFPEVFGRPNAGFDAIVGNPPFAGKNTLISGNPEYYLPWLQTLHEGAHGNADLVAHFFRRAYSLLRQRGAFGLIATKTISEGNTRAAGLRWLRKNGCSLYEARRDYKWPGVAAVVVSLVHGVKGPYSGAKQIDGQRVEFISAFLFHRGSDDDPLPLPENGDRCFVGSYILGKGFTFDDAEPDANPLELMHRLISNDEENASAIFPYIGGGELLEDPRQQHRRFVINFGSLSEVDARTRWPELMNIVESRVKAFRLDGNREARRRNWWQFAERAVGLYRRCAPDTPVLARSLTSVHFSTFCMLPPRMVYDQTVLVWPDGREHDLAILSSRVHESWVLFLGGSLGTTDRYNIDGCFETFPFPENWRISAVLGSVGTAYHDYRASLMIARDEGLTATYNRFHDPAEVSPDIKQLRDLHAAMDRAVLDAYGWTDLAPVAEYIPEFDEDDIEPGSRAKRKYRLRWPDEQRDDVLARLLELNRIRAG